VQLLFIGDLFQLPPVAQNHEWALLQEHYPSRFFFDSMVIRQQIPLLIELNIIYRQKEDSFIRLLNKVRNNYMDEDDFEDLHTRYFPGFRPERDENFITLTSHNNQADQINARELERLFTGHFIYNADIIGDFPEHLYPAEAGLELKEGAQVMFLKNDAVEKKYFNGKIGVVKTLEPDKIVVEADGSYITVEKNSWENTRYSVNKEDGKLEQEVVGSFTQFPLRLAWAITIHKSQGLTFDKVMIDAGSAFSSGQVYVALSRCTSLSGIVLLSKIPSTAIMSNEEVVKGQKALTHKGSLAERFEGARQVFTQQLLEDIFSFPILLSAVQSMVDAVKKEKNKFNAEGVLWLLAFEHQFLSMQSVGGNFIRHIYTMMKEEPVIEKNELLQKRISDAAHHFGKELTVLFNSIKAHSLITEHKEVADEVNETLLNTIIAVYTAHYYILYCKEAFTISSFLKHKLQFSLQKFNISCYASANKQVVSKTGIQNFELFETLKRWRDMVCDDTGMAIYMVANRQTLEELTTYLPFNKKDLLKISGFGKAKVDKYGDDVLEAINDYCVRYNLVTNIYAKSLNPVKEKRTKLTNITKTDTKLLTLELYQIKKSIEEVAKERQLTIGTIEGHLSYFIGKGNLDIREFVSAEKQQLIKEAIQIHGSLSHKTLIENLPENISYGQIKMVLALQPTP
ncbi:MAG: helix-turn-helix domain-containing protein, partial [Ferruginibacter sp.]